MFFFSSVLFLELKYPNFPSRNCNILACLISFKISGATDAPK